MQKVQANPTSRPQSGFTLVELLVVVGIIVALATVSVVAVSQFSGKGDEGARSAELATVQSAMDTMMADVAIQTVTASTTGSSGASDFTSVPTEGALLSYLRDNPTVYKYCWNASGKITQLSGAATCA